MEKIKENTIMHSNEWTLQNEQYTVYSVSHVSVFVQNMNTW